MTTLDELKSAIRNKADYGELLENIRVLISKRVSINQIRNALYQAYLHIEKSYEDTLGDLIQDMEMGKHGNSLTPKHVRRSVVPYLNFHLSIATEQGFNDLKLLANCISFDSGMDIFRHWLSDKNTLYYIKNWELLHNPNLNVLALNKYLNDAGNNNFILSLKEFVDDTGVAGFIYQHDSAVDILIHKSLAIDFCIWASPVFKLFFISNQRLFQMKQ